MFFIQILDVLLVECSHLVRYVARGHHILLKFYRGFYNKRMECVWNEADY
jgi:hypothetical protein